MRFKLAALILAASCLPAFAQYDSPHFTQGAISILSGRAHIMEGAEGTYIEIERPGATRKIRSNKEKSVSILNASKSCHDSCILHHSKNLL